MHHYILCHIHVHTHKVSPTAPAWPFDYTLHPKGAALATVSVGINGPHNCIHLHNVLPGPAKKQTMLVIWMFTKTAEWTMQSIHPLHKADGICFFLVCPLWMLQACCWDNPWGMWVWWDAQWAFVWTNKDHILTTSSVWPCFCCYSCCGQQLCSHCRLHCSHCHLHCPHCKLHCCHQ